MTRPKLADITQRADEHGPCTAPVCGSRHCNTARDRDTLLAAIRDVLALHVEDRGFCRDCDHAHPCPTVRAVTAHIDTTPKEKP